MRRRYLLVWALLVSVVIAGCGSSNGVIATVNGREITKKDYDQRYTIVKASYESQQGTTIDEKKDEETVKKLHDLAYEDLVVQKLLDEQAAKKGVKVTNKEIQDNVDYIKNVKNQNNAQGFNDFLKQLGMDEKQLEVILKEELIYNKMEEKVTAGVKVSDLEVKDYYSKNQKVFEEQGGIQIYHILVKDAATAREIINKLKAGGDWNKLASQYSIDDSNKNQGGDLGIVNESIDFVEEFKTAALKLQPGEITQEPVKTQFGYHIIKAGERKAAGIKSFEEVKDTISTQLIKDKKDKIFNQYIEDLKKKADIKDMRS
ncbi:MAG TPA: SurA N-terminal domain-containing protein [Syntrophomonadaceae bacterium]|nr:SurA N-terminal domain-containing protein [Syntrophomonadaceae bacterium]